MSDPISEEKARRLGKIYMTLTGATAEKAQETARGDIIKEVLLSCWKAAVENPKLLSGISEDIAAIGPDLPAEGVSTEFRKAFLEGCLSDEEAPVKRYRKLQGLSQKELADLAGVKQSQISRWESGSTPNRESLGKLSAVLSCAPEDLVPGRIRKYAELLFEERRDHE